MSNQNFSDKNRINLKSSRKVFFVIQSSHTSEFSYFLDNQLPTFEFSNSPEILFIIQKFSSFFSIILKMVNATCQSEENVLFCLFFVFGCSHIRNRILRCIIQVFSFFSISTVTIWLYISFRKCTYTQQCSYQLIFRGGFIDFHTCIIWKINVLLCLSQVQIESLQNILLIVSNYVQYFSYSPG